MENSMVIFKGKDKKDVLNTMINPDSPTLQKTPIETIWTLFLDMGKQDYKINTSPLNSDKWQELSIL